MKKKHVIMMITCIILIAAGICYSVTYFGLGASTPVITTLSGEGSDDSGSQGNISEVSGKYASDAASSTVGLSGSDKALAGNDITSTGTPESGSSKGDPSNRKDDTEIYVHLCGAVKIPSVYKVVSGSRLVEIIELAGGLTKEAAGDYINQAMVVEDGQRIYIPTKSEVQELTSQNYITGGSNDSRSEESKLININEADTGELMDLPGIGQAKADSIVEYRNDSGGFQSIEDLMKVPGIKEGLFNQISSYITIK